MGSGARDRRETARHLAELRRRLAAVEDALAAQALADRSHAYPTPVSSTGATGSPVRPLAVTKA